MRSEAWSGSSRDVRGRGRAADHNPRERHHERRGRRLVLRGRELRVLTGRLLGQFQHRVAQYNYVDESEVLRRWADGYDTRLFVRRRIHETEPVVGVVGPGSYALPIPARCGRRQHPRAYRERLQSARRPRL